MTRVPNHPTGRAHPGYRNRLYQSETIDGVKVVRVWTFLAANEGFALRTLNYLSFLMSAIVALIWLPRSDVVVSTSPQFFCGLAGLFARIFRGVPWVLEVRDLWPESIVTVGAMRKGLSIRALEWLEKLAYRHADGVVSVTDSFVPHISRRCGRPGKITVIKNGADLTFFRRDPDQGAAMKRALGLQNRFVAAYVGTHGMAHGLETILNAAELLRGDKRIAFLMVGDGAERVRLAGLVSQRRLGNVVILGPRPKAEMPGIWAATDASIILLKRNALFRTVLPSKMFEAMAMQCPIVLGVEGEARALLDAAQAGIGIVPESADELASAILHLAGDAALARGLGAQGAAYARDHFDRSRLAARYVEYLQNIVERGLAKSQAQLSRQAGAGIR